MDSITSSAELINALNPFAQSGLADYALFRLVSGWITSRVEAFGLGLMGRSMALVGGIGLSCVTTWMLYQGYRILSGAREPMMGVILQGAKVAVIFSIATTMAVNNIELNSFFTQKMDKAIHGWITGKEGQSTASSIDKSLAVLQLAMTAIDGVQLLEPDPELIEEKRSAKQWAFIGSAAPAIAAGCMLLLLTFSLNLWIGLGPLFIFALAFPATKSMFTTWLKQGVGILVTMAVLSYLAGLLLDLAVGIATATWVAKLANIPGAGAEGITSQAMNQGSIGMIMTVLIVSVPPLAAFYFQAQVSTPLANSVFGRGGAAGGPGNQVGHSAPPAPTASRSAVDLPPPRSEMTGHATRTMTDSTPVHSNEIKRLEERR